MFFPSTVIVSYSSMVSVTEQMDLFELHVCIRDYCFAREDRLVGVAIMRLSDIAEQVGHCITVFFILIFVFTNRNLKTRVPVRAGCHSARESRWMRLDGRSYEYYRRGIVTK